MTFKVKRCVCFRKPTSAINVTHGVPGHKLSFSCHKCAIETNRFETLPEAEKAWNKLIEAKPFFKKVRGFFMSMVRGMFKEQYSFATLLLFTAFYNKINLKNYWITVVIFTVLWVVIHEIQHIINKGESK